MGAQPGRNRVRSPLVATSSRGGADEVSTSTLAGQQNRREHIVSLTGRTPNGGREAPAPLVEAVVHRSEQRHELPFHVPGHKRGSRLRPAQIAFMDQSCWGCDTTELAGLDNLQNPEGAIRHAATLASELWGCDHTWFLVNGATTGIHAAIMATCPAADDCLIMARNAHQSAFHGAVLAGCRVRYVMPACGDGIAHHVTVESLEKAFKGALDEKGVRVRAVLIVSPTYYGVQSDLVGLKAVCDRHGALLIVDEAHGAHLDFLSPVDGALGRVDEAMGPPLGGGSALAAGASLVVQSTHKQLGSLTQSSMLHAQGIEDTLKSRIDRVLRMLQSSSPSYLLMASLDASRAALAEAIATDDETYIGEPHAAAMRIREYFDSFDDGRIVCSGCHMALRLLTVEGAHSMDPWRLTVLVDSLCHEENGKENRKENNNNSNQDRKDGEPNRGKQPTGWSVASLLESERGVVAEMATKNAIVFACSIGTTMHHAQGLIAALDWLSTYADADGTLQYYTKDADAPEHVCGILIDEEHAHTSTCPRDAYTAKATPLPLALATDRTAAETITVYPPGIPIVCIGDTLTNDTLAELAALKNSGASITGATDPTINTILVVSDSPL